MFVSFGDIEKADRDNALPVLFIPHPLPDF
jgi:hypothetical protein